MNRNVLLLALAQAIMMSVNSLMVTSAALIGSQLATNKALATLPLALQFVAVMTTTIPASMLMGAVGRKRGFLLATVIGIAGGTCGVIGIYRESFLLFCIGCVGTGMYTGFGNYFRFAATEISTAGRKNTAIGYVLAGGVLAAVIGPNLANLSKDIFAITYLGTLLSVVALYALNGVNFLCMKLPPPARRDFRPRTRTLSQIASQPRFIVAVASAAIGYGVMVLLMTASPLEMTHQQHAFSEVAFVIQWHVLGMFVPSFFTGHLINRYGAPKIIMTGATMMISCILLNFNGNSVGHFWAALVALGIGWNFMFIGGTSLLTETYRPQESARAQALNEFVVFSSAACASFGAGALLHLFGWQLVNFAVVPLIVLVLLAHGWLWLNNRKITLASR
ncbi:MAG: MFS transporter [Gammaproteobacteria bacterium]|nr:MFS transporter [Gammaproteobacteria bacterium]MDH3447257.1 MFS transporter [Gammaproteobacteria bacterium]